MVKVIVTRLAKLKEYKGGDIIIRVKLHWFRIKVVDNRLLMVTRLVKLREYKVVDIIIRVKLHLFRIKVSDARYLGCMVHGLS